MTDGDPATAVFDPGGDCCVVMMYVMRTAGHGLSLSTGHAHGGTTDVVPPALRTGATCPDRHVMGFDAMHRNAMQCGQILRWRLSGRWCVCPKWIDSNLLVFNFLVVQCYRK